jgi:hypothetical protein
MKEEELRKITNRCHDINMFSHKIGMKFEMSLKTLTDDEYDQFGTEAEGRLDDARIVLDKKVDLVNDLADLYLQVLESRDDLMDKYDELIAPGKKYFSDIKPINI